MNGQPSEATLQPASSEVTQGRLPAVRIAVTAVMLPRVAFQAVQAVHSMTDDRLEAARDEGVSRDEAKALGLKRYFTGVPCKRGHIAERSVRSGRCLECSRARTARWAAANPERVREKRRKHRAANLEKIREKDREAAHRRYIKNRDKIRSQQAAWRAANKVEIAAYQRQWYAKNKERVRSKQAAWRAANKSKRSPSA
jgi:hypothetical protein